MRSFFNFINKRKMNTSNLLVVAISTRNKKNSDVQESFEEEEEKMMLGQYGSFNVVYRAANDRLGR